MLHARVREKLSDPTVRVLIVIDDVWWAEDVRLLLVDGPQSRVVITTRMVSVAQKLGWDSRNQIIALPTMSEAESLAAIVQTEDGSVYRLHPVVSGYAMYEPACKAMLAE